jgi:hypothetical protein
LSKAKGGLRQAQPLRGFLVVTSALKISGVVWYGH